LNGESQHSPDAANDPNAKGGAYPSPPGQGPDTSWEELKSQLQDAQDRALRSQAELENFRRRMRRDMEEERRFAFLPVIVDLLPVLDNVQRAIQAAEKNTESSGLLTGVKLVAQQITSLLEKHHCRRIPADGAQFDPQLHEALTQQVSADHPPNTVILVHQDGYQLHERVIRPAQVVVSAAQPGKS
jgi:molecular chaperone GrpE